MKRAPASVLWTLALFFSVYGQTPATHPAGAYAQVNGAKLWYETEGQGEPLVLVAGGPGDSHSEFHPFFSRLTDRFQVIYFDAFGVGKSDHAKSRKEYTFAREVEDLEGLRKALGVSQMNLLGHSFGGMVAQACSQVPAVGEAPGFGRRPYSEPQKGRYVTGPLVKRGKRGPRFPSGENPHDLIFS